DDVKNDQRKAIFEQRIDFMSASSVEEIVADMRSQLVQDLVGKHVPEKAYAEQWDIPGLEKEIEEIFGEKVELQELAAKEGVADTEISERLLEETSKMYAKRAVDVGPDIMRRLEKAFLLHVLDTNWREHLQQLDHLQSVVWMRGHAQRDPINEFKTEAFSLFEALLEGLRRDVTRMLMNVQVRSDPALAEPQRRPIPMTEIHQDPLTGENEMEFAEAAVGRPSRGSAGVSSMAAAAKSRAVDPQNPATWGSVARNSPCPCGSGKKFKHCHGTI
ncbi:MAG: SEC-C domain-containing protein, partial [Parvularculaceae bacterium]|nr:SEC-C domain-containing protein [Parvularculaceae bacterium]